MLIGHHTTFDRLKAQGQAGQFHHAQLFIGPEHVGKTKVAQLLSVALQQAEDDVILKKHILEGVHADTLLFLDDGEGLPIETVRRIIERATQSHHSPHLIFIIENLGRMKVEAMNALLKTLEEPGEGVIFLLTANREEDVLPTVRSRCHVTYFQTVSDSELKTMTQGHVFEDQLLFFAMGCPGKLKRLLDEPDYLTAHQAILQDVLQFMENPKASRVFELVRAYEGHELRAEMLDILLQRTRTWALARRLDSSLLNRAAEAKDLLKQNVNAKLVLENLLLSFVP